MARNTAVGVVLPREDPEVQALEARVTELGARVLALRQKVAETEEAIRRASVAPDLEERALALVEAGELPERPDAAPLRGRLGTLRDELEVTIRAEELARRALRETEGRAANRAVQATLPEYRELLQALADALVALQEPLQAVQAFENRLQTGGVSPAGLRVPQWRMLDIFRYGSPAARFVAELRDDHGVRVPEGAAPVAPPPMP